MTDIPLLATADQINALARALVRYNCVAKFDRNEETEGGAMAHLFGDLEASFRKFLHELLPKLVAEDLSEEGAREILGQIGDEFRHILFHMKDSRYYRYLWEQV